jgi:hypothetical protein
MAAIHNGRFTVKIEGEFVVFLIGMRINRLLLLHKWIPVARAMPRMLKELFAHKDMGLLHAQSFVGWRTVVVVQYWRSFDQLHAYAHARELAHLPAWADFNRRVGGNGSVGIFHETYLVNEGAYEAVYANVPTFGLAHAGQMMPAIGRMQSAKSRMDRPDADS